MQPQLTEIILKSLGRRRGPAVDSSVSGGITQVEAQEYAKKSAAENAQAGINLGAQALAQHKDISGERLAAGQEQFEKGLAWGAEKYEMGMEAGQKRFGENLAFEKYRHDTGLSSGRERFDESLAFSNEQARRAYETAAGDLSYNKRASNMASLISALGLGLEGVGAYQGRKRTAERTQAVNGLIESYKKMGDEQGIATARLLELMRIY